MLQIWNAAIQMVNIKVFLKTLWTANRSFYFRYFLNLKTYCFQRCMIGHLQMVSGENEKVSRIIGNEMVTLNFRKRLSYIRSSCTLFTVFTHVGQHLSCLLHFRSDMLFFLTSFNLLSNYVNDKDFSIFLKRRVDTNHLWFPVELFFFFQRCFILIKFSI